MANVSDISLIPRKLEAIDRAFKDKLETRLWSSEPTVQLMDLCVPVSTLDNLKSRIASLTAVFDHFNKKEFDKQTGLRSTGSRIAFVAFLKTRFKDSQPVIEQYVEDPIGKICLLRDLISETHLEGDLKTCRKA